MQKNKILKRIDRIIFQAIVMGDNLTADDVLRLGNHARFKKKLFMVGDTCRVSVRKLSNSASIFTVVNFYYINLFYGSYPPLFGQIEDNSIS